APPPPHPFPTRRSSDLPGASLTVGTRLHIVRSAIRPGPGSPWEARPAGDRMRNVNTTQSEKVRTGRGFFAALDQSGGSTPKALRSEEHTSELQSRVDLV